MKLTAFFQKFGNGALPRWLRRKLKKLISTFRKTTRHVVKTAGNVAKTAVTSVVLVGAVYCSCTTEALAANYYVNYEQRKTATATYENDYYDPHYGEYYNYSWQSDTSYAYTKTGNYGYTFTEGVNLLSTISSGDAVVLTDNHSTNSTLPNGYSTTTPGSLYSYRSQWGSTSTTDSAISISGNVSLIDQRNSTYTFSNGITKSGTGTLTISGSSSTFNAGAVSVQGGGLTYDSGTTGTLSSLSISNGATFTKSGNALTISNGVSSSGTFTNSSSATLTISSGGFTNNSTGIYTDAAGGAVTISSGGLSNSGSFSKTNGTLSVTGGVDNSTASSTITLNGTNTSITGNVSNSGTITKQNGGNIGVTGTFTNNASGHYNDTGSGNLAVTSAITNYGDFDKTGSGAITGYTLTNSGTSANMNIAGSTSMTIGGGSGTVTNTGGATITKHGTGAIATGSWTNTNSSYTDDGSGGVTITGTLTNNGSSTFEKTGSGQLKVTSNVANNGTSNITIDGSVTTDIDGNLTNADLATVTISSTGLTNIDGSVDNKGTVTKTDTGNISVGNGWTNSSTASYTDTGSGNVSITGNLNNTENSEFNKTGSGTLSVSQNVINDDTSSITLGGTVVTTVTGYVDNSGDVTKHGSGNITVNGSQTQPIEGNNAAVGWYNHVGSTYIDDGTGDTTIANNHDLVNEGATFTKNGTTGTLSVTKDVYNLGTDATGIANGTVSNFTVGGGIALDVNGNVINTGGTNSLPYTGGNATFTISTSSNSNDILGYVYNGDLTNLTNSAGQSFISNQIFNDAGGNLAIHGNITDSYINNTTRTLIDQYATTPNVTAYGGASVLNYGTYNKTGSGTTTLDFDFDTRNVFTATGSGSITVGTDQGLAGANEDLLISGTGTWNSTGTLKANDFVLGHYSNGMFTVSAGNVRLSGTTDVGEDNGNGTLVINGGSVFSGNDTSDYTYVGSRYDAHTGTVNVSSGTWTTSADVNIGNNSAGTSIITPTDGTPSRNSVSYYGNAVWGNGYEPFPNDPLTDTAHLSSAQTGVLNNVTGQGTVNLSGGTWNVGVGGTEDANIGVLAAGAVNQTGGIWNNADTNVGTTFDGAGAYSSAIADGQNRGAVRQSGGTHNDTNVNIGDSNNGVYDLYGGNSTKWNTLGTASISNTEGVVGQVNIYQDADWTITGTAGTNSLIVGNDTWSGSGTDIGKGILRIDNRNGGNGGDVTVTNGNIIMANQQYAQGYVYVNGQSSSLQADNGYMNVANGENSYGRLDIGTGGYVGVLGTAVDGNGNKVTIANSTGSHGQAYVHGKDGTGIDSKWDINGNLTVADEGNAAGLLDIYQEGDVNVTGSGNVVIANAAAAFGTINVRNLDSTFTINSGTLTVAELGTGLLHISDRGFTDVGGGMTIANGQSARGTTIVELFARLDVGADMIVAAASGAEGNLYVRSGSTVHVENHDLIVAQAAGSIGRAQIDGNFTQLNVDGTINVAASGQAGGRYTENRLDPRYQADPTNGIWSGGDEFGNNSMSHTDDHNQTGYIKTNEASENPFAQAGTIPGYTSGYAPTGSSGTDTADPYLLNLNADSATNYWNANPTYNSSDALAVNQPGNGYHTGNDPGFAITRGAHVNSGNAIVGDATGSYAYVVIDNKGFNTGEPDWSENAVYSGDGTINQATAAATSHQNVGATRSTWTVGTLDAAGTLRTATAADGVTNPVSGLSNYHQINTDGLLEIGRNGGEGMFRVINGGLLHTGETIIADATGSVGYLHVDGFDTVSGRSEFISDGLTTVGNATGTDGMLRVSNGARAVTEGLSIAVATGSSGVVSVEGFYDLDHSGGYSSDDVRSLLEIYKDSTGVSSTEAAGNSLFSASNHALVWMWEGADLQLNGIGQITTGATLHLNGHVDNTDGSFDATTPGAESGEAGVPLFDANTFSVNVTNARVEGNGIIRAQEGISFVQDSGLIPAGLPGEGERRTPGQAEIDPGLFYGWDCTCENPERYGTLEFQTNTLSMTGNVITYFDVNSNIPNARDRIFVMADGEHPENVTASLGGTLKLNARLTEEYYKAGQDYTYDIITTQDNGLIQQKFDKVDIVPNAFFELAETDLGYGQTIDRLQYDDPTGTGVAGHDGDILHLTMRAIADPFERAGKTYNQRSTGHALDQIYAEENKDWLPVLRYFWNQYDPNAFLDAYSLFSGEIRAHSLLMPTSDIWSVATDRIGFSRKTGHATLGYQNRNFGREYGNGLWGSALYNQTTTISDGNAYGFDLKRTGFVVGFDRVSQGGDSTTGVLFHFNHGELDTYRAGATDEDYQFGLYHSRRILDYVEWKNYIGVGLQSYHTHRDLDVALRDYTVCGVPGDPNSCPTGNCDMVNGICTCGHSESEQTLRSRYHGYTFSASTELARPYYFGEMRQWAFRPFVGLNINAVWQNRSWEQGDFTGAELVALKFESANLFRTYGRVGAGLERGGNHANMYLNAAYSYLLGGRRYTDVNNRFQFGGEEFNIRGVDDGSGFFTANVGGSIFLDKYKRGMVFMDYKVIAGSHSSTQAFQLGLQKNF
jgi:T5SS/PEP-CTERM-associated repeat protein